ncbi:MAG: MqnA/MqnD/SBP family protein, partial [Planctomycetota bacterium]
MSAPDLEPTSETALGMTSKASLKTLRVGSVPYLVGRPLDHGLGDEPGITLEHDVPAKLIERLRAGDIDVALVSSIELFRRKDY